LTALLTNYYDAAHRYLPQDYRADVNATPITAAVACEFGAADAIAEAIWVQQCADRFGVPNAFIAAVQLESPNLSGVLARYRDLPIVRAVRQPLYWAADPSKRLGARGDYLSDPAWLRGFEQVAAAGLVWDLLVYDEQLPAAHELIASFPDTTFVLIDHLLWDGPTMVSTVQAVLADLSANQQAEFFGQTARRVYRVPVSS
jgi:predicted TIM-barrel fold metal-dependent hydrolase